MSVNKPIRRIAIVGTGVIGASWAAYYLSRGSDVVATNPSASAEASLREYVDNAWPVLARAGLPAGGSRERLKFTASMSRALAEADLVQENAPERPDFKVKLFAEMDQAAPPDAITMDVMQSACWWRKATSQVSPRLSRTPGAFRNFLLPRGSSKPEWLR